MKITEKTIQALKIIEEHGPIKPREFAGFMWPDSDRWTNRTKCGPHGVTKGGGMNLAGGGLLGKLRNRGLVYWSEAGHSLTRLGRETLREHGEK